jgi:hypothetical protein
MYSFLESVNTCIVELGPVIRDYVVMEELEQQYTDQDGCILYN